ncbi:MAG: gamma-glutamyl-gamma-aminobutyrate hydrolase family protein [Bacilli bacterium]|nr:gamma-glutamyl-gamma-aminobutyrate hydrolase family protein [Bacilli bacterium]
MKAVIGVPLRYEHLDDGRCILYLGEKVRRCIQKASGYVLPIAPVQDVDYMDTRGNEFPELTDLEKDTIEDSLGLVDGIFFPGGRKFTPYDRYLLERCIEKRIPVLGICLGMQLMSCYLEDVSLEKNESVINHKQESDEGFTHKVKIARDTKLYEIVGEDEIEVNSFHNYHATINKTYNISAVSEDGLIEGIELPGNVFNIGVQWHPEISYDFDDNSRKIIDAYIEACYKYRDIKEKAKLNNLIEKEK